ncbi:MAG TPA: rhamnogalacturonan acetylesterase [Tepidisphaeraceae bacterium]|nr:rhamnogalacturonan acetylesterase [Tepidisphaeraceae bacterium]
MYPKPITLGIAIAFAVALFSLASHHASAQIASVDVSDPSNPEVSYDPDPTVFAPDIPENVLQMYLPSPTDTANAGVSAVQKQNAVAVAAIALGASGVVTSTESYETAPYTAQEPTVTTSQPDTYTLDSGKKAAVYYIEPPQANGPYKQFDDLPVPCRFEFGPASLPTDDGYIRITEQTTYGPLTGYGWSDTSQVVSGDNGGSNSTARGFCRMAHGRAGGAIDQAVVSPTQFFVDVPNGTYKVSITSAPDKPGDTSRLSVWANGAPQFTLSTKSLTGVSGTFTINVYDGRLMLEFFNSLDKVESATDPNTWVYVNGVTIERIPDDTPHKPTVFVASDSTAASYSPSIYPLTGWGARLQNFLTDDVVIEDDAVAGASSKSFYEHRWLKMIENRIRPGDYFIVMFAINDSADDLPTQPATKRKTSPSSDFKAYLRQYVNAARDHGATPIFVTSQTKRTYDAWGRFYNSVGAYPQAQAQLGAELKVPVIDLNTKSVNFLDAVGVDDSADIYMFFPGGQYPGWPNGDADYIHLQDNGATQYAHLIVQGIREQQIQPLAQFVLDTPHP